MHIHLEVEYLTPDKKLANVHIRENDLFKGKQAVGFIKGMINALFATGVEAIVANTPKGDESRHVRIFDLLVGMKPVKETENTVIYALKKGE